MRILYGTGNLAKLAHMRKIVSGLDGLELIGPAEAGVAPLDVPEEGAHPLDNARAKALAYFAAYGIPVVAADSGLYIDGLPEHLQPGVHVRRIGGERLDDAGMTAYYGGLAASYGGRLICRYRNAICLVTDSGVLYEHDGDDIASDCFAIVQQPHARREEGFPLDALSVHIESGMYYNDYKENRDAYKGMGMKKGFRDFFTRSLACLGG